MDLHDEMHRHSGSTGSWRLGMVVGTCVGLGAVILLCFQDFSCIRSNLNTQVSAESNEFTPPDARYQGLDTLLGSNIKIGNAGDSFEISIGTLTIRRKKSGIVRFGMLNEVVIDKLRVTLSKESIRRSIAGAVTETLQSTRSSDNRSMVELLAGSYPILRSLSKESVSGLIVQDFECYMVVSEGENVLIMRAGLIESKTSLRKGGQLVMSGNVVLASLQGGTITCDRAIFSSDGSCVLKAGGYSARASEGAFDRLDIDPAFFIADGEISGGTGGLDGSLLLFLPLF